MKRDRRNLGNTLTISNIKTSDVTPEEAQKSCIDSFSEGLSYLTELTQQRYAKIKRKDSK